MFDHINEIVVLDGLTAPQWRDLARELAKALERSHNGVSGRMRHVPQPWEGRCDACEALARAREAGLLEETK